MQFLENNEKAYTILDVFDLVSGGVKTLEINYKASSHVLILARKKQNIAAGPTPQFRVVYGPYNDESFRLGTTLPIGPIQTNPNHYFINVYQDSFTITNTTTAAGEEIEFQVFQLNKNYVYSLESAITAGTQEIIGCRSIDNEEDVNYLILNQGANNVNVVLYGYVFPVGNIYIFGPYNFVMPGFSSLSIDWSWSSGAKAVPSWAATQYFNVFWKMHGRIYNVTTANVFLLKRITKRI